MSDFREFNIETNTINDIYQIGNDATHEGVIPEIAAAFSYDLTKQPSTENLGGLIAAVGPAKELQSNIGLVQSVLGTDESAVDIARGWSNRSGLLLPVEQSYKTGENIDGNIAAAVVTGGVRNWMIRRIERLSQLTKSREVNQVLLVAGNREMKPSEGADVEEGMTEADYMRTIIAQKLASLGIAARFVAVESGVGDNVMSRGVDELKKIIDPNDRVAVVSNAGAWVQNAGQFRRALVHPDGFGPDFDQNGEQLIVVSDEFPLGTGVEPAATHQNPFSAIGQIVRNAQELARQYDNA